MHVPKYSRLLALFLIGSVAIQGAIPAWASSADSEASLATAMDFRATFRALLGKKISDEQFDHLIYLPNKPLLQGPEHAENASDFLGELATLFQHSSPTALYLGGKNKTPGILPRSMAKLTLEKLGSDIQDRMTLIIVPGFMSELISTGTFDELFNVEGSAYQRVWKQKLTEASPSLTTDLRYSLKALDFENVPISETIRVSSMDWQSQSLVNLVRFDFGPQKSAAGVDSLSLESVQGMREAAKIFMRRLGKFFQIMGTPKNIAFVGYSRGTPVALEMLARASEKPSAYPWIRNVKGMVSLGGVVYGSDQADYMFNEMQAAQPPRISQQLMLISELSDTLQPPEKLPSSEIHDRTTMIRNNNHAWGKFLAGLTKMYLKSDSPAPYASDEETAAAESSLSQAMTAISDAKKMDMTSILHTALKIGANSFRLDPIHFYTDYGKNIFRMKAFVNAVLTGARELTTQERTGWWAANTVPTSGLRYYALTASMSDPRGNSAEKEMADCPLCFNLSSADYKGKVGDYRDFRDTTGYAINDGAMGAHKARFWPELNRLLNPGQNPIESRFLGTIAAHHYGLALRVVSASSDETENFGVDPYPRGALLEALATTITKDILNSN